VGDSRTPRARVTVSSKVQSLVPALLDWFSLSARDLPWRRTLDPYAVWVSEIMLQQTQVKTVIPYWERWMRELPTVQALAAVKPERVLKLWEGLGYYTRARNLQQAAQQIVSQHGGRFPDSFEAILALPGVGRYTAGAIASIAFNQATPILDGNVIRVLARLFGIDQDPREKATNARLWHLATQFVETADLKHKIRHSKLSTSRSHSKFEIRHSKLSTSRSHSKLEIRHSKLSTSRSHSKLDVRHSTFLLSGSRSALNQSLMELGALVCTRRQPLCARCPVRRNCVARTTGRVDIIPNLGKRVPATPRRFVSFVMQRDGRWLVRQRPAGVVNARLWEFPNVEVDSADTDITAAAARIVHSKGRIFQPLTTVKHSITRYRICLEAYVATAHGNFRKRKGDLLLSLPELQKLAFTGAHRKVLEALQRLTTANAGKDDFHGVPLIGSRRPDH
jgi:A/G-specific adenine glycosylase